LWRIAWSSDDLRYGGAGVAPVETRRNWRLPGHAAVLLEPQPAAGVDDPVNDGGESEEAEVRREALKQSERGQ
jgi:maltooligosyltrehalose trehalohydrolase